MNWKTTPDSEGDWLWVAMWGCGCCIRASGIAWVSANLSPHWEGQSPYFVNGVPDITHWLKLTLPDK